ncbi:MAG: PKD domain-containing protein [Methanomicrobiales archaeon]
MKDKKNCHISELGVSELIGALILISMIVLVVAVIAAGLISSPSADKVPQVKFSVVNTTNLVNGVPSYSISITHIGGDEISDGNYAVFIDGKNITDFTVNSNPDKKWSIGRIITVNSTNPPGLISVYYTGTNSPTLLGQRSVGPIPFTIPCSPPVANFYGVPLTGDQPLTVQFTDTSTNNPSSWIWENQTGGGSWTQFSTAQSPRQVFTLPGVYNIRLTASNAGCSNSKIEPNYITVNAVCTKPSAAFNPNISSGTAPLTVKFTDQSTGSPTSRSWNFGDNGTSSLQSPSYTFVSPGTYNVNLTVSNACNSNSIIKQITVSLPSCGYISGTKWNDIDGDGSRDVNEPGLADWRINVRWTSNNSIAGSAITNVNGDYIITGLIYTGPDVDTKYDIEEISQSGWIQTYPSGGVWRNVHLKDTSPCYANNIDFGNRCTGFTIWAWVKWINKPSTPLDNQTFATIVVKGNSNFNRQYHLEHDQDNTKFEFNIATVLAGGQGIQVFSTTNPIKGVWYLITGVYNPTSPGTMTIYVNNSPQSSRSVDSSGLRAYSGNQQIGGPSGINWPNPPPSQQQRVFNGSIYGVQTFDYVKTQAEIQTHYNIQDHPT